jgi:hypothetical protein
MHRPTATSATSFHFSSFFPILVSFPFLTQSELISSTDSCYIAIDCAMLSPVQGYMVRSCRRNCITVEKYGTKKTTNFFSSTAAFSSKNSKNTTSSATYIDNWFDSIRKPQEFYDHWASGEKIRRYFYNIDLQGRLFLEETAPKNIATSIKDEYVTKYWKT